MPAPRQNWLLFVDESGRIEDPACAALVTGVLVQGYDDPQAGLRLRQALAEVYPLATYPPHAAYLNLPVSQAAACMLSAPHEREGQNARWLRAAAGPAITALGVSRDGPPQDFRAMIERCTAGQRLDHGVLSSCDTWLRRHAPASHDKLRWEMEKQRTAMTQLLKMVGRECYGMDRCFVVGAWDAGGGGPAGDRYLRLLSTLLERTAQIVGGGAAAPTLWIYVATRDVVEHGARRPLGSRHVQDRANAAPHPLPGGSGLPPIVAVARPPQAYDADVHPGIVLADFVANQLGHVLRVDRTWRETADAAERHVGLAVEARPSWMTATSKLPTLAIEGPWRDAVRGALSGADLPAPPPASDLPAWTREQADAWIAAARSADRGGAR